MADSLSLIWGHSCTLQNYYFVILKHYAPNFHPILSKLYTRYPNHEAIHAIPFLAIYSKKMSDFAVQKKIQNTVKGDGFMHSVIYLI